MRFQICYGYQAIAPKYLNNNPIGGRSLTEAAIDARIRFGNFGVVPFLDAGQLYTSSLPRFSGMRYGAGLGLRYYSSFGPIRVDVGTPLNPGPGHGRIALYLSQLERASCRERVGQDVEFPGV